MKIATSIGRRFLLLTALVLAAHDVAAQTPVQTFADLQPLLKAGQRVIVRDDGGRKTVGRVVSVTGNQLEIRRRRWFRQEPVIFAEDSVRRVEDRDSTWNGALLGLGIGSLTALVGCNSVRHPDVDWSCMGWIQAIWGGLLVGEAIDGDINRPLFVSVRGSRITLLPLLGGERAGLAAAIRF